LETRRPFGANQWTHKCLFKLSTQSHFSIPQISHLGFWGFGAGDTTRDDESDPDEDQTEALAKKLSAAGLSNAPKKVSD
jgi:hypothetical protein